MILLMLLFLFASPAFAVDYFFCSTGNDANDCTNHTTQLCKTCNRAMTRSATTGRRILLCDSDTLHEDPVPCTANGSGASAANPNIIGLYDADDGSYIPPRGSPPPGDGSVPVYTQFQLKTGWQQCTTGVCPAPINGNNPNIWRVSHTVAGLANVMSGRGILIDPFLQNTSAHGFNCTFDWADPSTWDDLPNCWHPNRGSWGDINGGNSITCPSTQLNQNYEYCYNTTTDHVYLYSTTNPNTTFTSPGILLVNRAPNRPNSAFVFDGTDSNWVVENFAVIGCAHNCFFIDIGDGNHSNITARSMLFRHARYRTPSNDPGGSDGSNTGSPIFQSGLVGAGASDVGNSLSNVTLQDIEASDTGRDWFSLGVEACVQGVTLDNVLAYNIFNHAWINLKHDGVNAACRDDISINNVTLLHNCDSTIGLGGAGSMAAGKFVNVTFSNSAVGLPVIAGDPRLPDQAACSGVGNQEAIDVDRPRANWTLSRLALIGIETPISVRNGDSTVSCNHCTLAGYNTAVTRQGVEVTVAGGTATMNRSIIHNHGTAGIGGTTAEFFGQVDGAIFTGGDAAGSGNGIFHNGSATFARKGTTNYTLATWRTANPNADGDSELEDCALVNVANRDIMLSAASPCIADLTDTPRVGANTDKGALEELGITSCQTTGANSFSCTIETIFSRNVEGVPANITSVTGSTSGAHTITGCTVGTTATVPTCSVTPAFVGGETLTLVPAYGAFRQCALGATQACIYAKSRSTASVPITNNISAGAMRVADCVYYNAAPDIARVTITDIPTLPLQTTNAGWRGRRGTSTCPGAQQSAPTAVTVDGQNQILVDNVGAVASGECAHMSYDPATGATTDSSGTPVEVETTTNFLCRNRVGFTDTPGIFVSGTTIDADTIEICWSADFLPLAPASGATGVTARRNGAAWTVSGTGTRQGNNCYRFDMTTSAVAGETLDVSYSQGTGNIVDADSVPNEVNAFTNQTIDNTLTGAPTVGTLVAEGCQYLRSGINQQTINAENSILNGTVNGDIQISAGGTIRERCQFSCQGAAACPTQSYQIACSDNAGTDWYLPGDTHGSNLIACGQDATVSAQEATTDVLSGGTGTFVAGRRTKRGNCVTQSIALTNGQHTEIETVLQLNPELTSGTARCEGRISTNTAFDTPQSSINPVTVTAVAGTATR